MKKFCIALSFALLVSLLPAQARQQTDVGNDVLEIVSRYEMQKTLLPLENYFQRKGDALSKEEVEQRAQVALLNDLRKSGLSLETQRLVFELSVMSKNEKTTSSPAYRERREAIEEQLFLEQLSCNLSKHTQSKLEKELLESVLSAKKGDTPVYKLPKEELNTTLQNAGIPPKTAEAISETTAKFKLQIGIKDIAKKAASLTLQEVVNLTFNEKEAAVMNSAIKEYLENPDSTVKSAAYTALEETAKQYIADDHARETLLQEIRNSREGKKVDVEAAGKALAEGGLKLYIDNTNLSPEEKQLAKAAISEVLGKGGEIPAASAVLLKDKLLEHGFSEERAAIIAQNTQTFLENPKNTNALRLAGITAVQELVVLNLNEKPAAIVNDAINEYLATGDFSDSAYRALESTIAQYVQDSEVKDVLLESVTKAKNGEKIDLKKVGSTVAGAGLKHLVENSNLSNNEKRIVEGMIDEFVSGKDGSLMTATGDVLKEKLIKKGIDPEKAESLAGYMQAYLADRGNVNAANALAREGIQVALDLWLPEEAKPVGDALAALMKPGATMDDAALAAYNNIVGEHIKDEDLKEAFLKLGEDIRAGKPIDSHGVSTAIPFAVINQMIDETKLTNDQKKLIKELMKEYGEDMDFLSTPAAREALAGALQEAGLSEEDAEKIANQLGDLAAGKAGALDDLLESAEVIFSSMLKEAIHKQLDEVFAKLPSGLQELLGALGLEPKFIAEFLSNMDNLKLLFEGIVNGSLEAWKELADKLVEHVWSSVCAFVEKALIELLDLLLEKVVELASRIDALQKYMGLIQMARVVITDLGTTVIQEGVQSIENYGDSVWNSIKITPSSNSDQKNNQKKPKVVPRSDIGKTKIVVPRNDIGKRLPAPVTDTGKQFMNKKQNQKQP